MDLFPIYAIGNINGFDNDNDYLNYLEAFLNGPNTDENQEVVVYNNYLNSHDATNPRYFENMALIADLADGRPYWGFVDARQDNCDVLQTCTTWLTIRNQLQSYIRFQANVHIAYGFTGLGYFTYNTADPFPNESIAHGGEPTQKYPWVQTLNNYIENVVGPVVVSSQNLSAFHRGNFLDQNGNVLEIIPTDRRLESTPIVQDLSQDRSMVGIFRNDANNFTYLYLINTGYSDVFPTFDVTVSIYGDYRGDVEVAATSSPWNYTSVNATYSGNLTSFTAQDLEPGEGRLYRIFDDGHFGRWDVSYSNMGGAEALPAPADFDGDGVADISVKTDIGDYWKIDYASNGFGSWDASYANYGGIDVHHVPADYDGDGLDDLSVKADFSGGKWFIDYASNGFGRWDVIISNIGDAAARPAPADFDGDGKTDLSVKTDAGYWRIDYTSNGFGKWDVSLPNYGGSDVHPVPADYDGDGEADLSVKADFSGGKWFINYASNGFTSGWDATYSNIGGATAQGVPADFDGDGEADLSVKTDAGEWKIDYASDGFGSWDVTYINYGGTDVHPVPADYDGDGRDDLSVKADFGGGIWFIDYAGFFSEETGTANKFDQYAAKVSSTGDGEIQVLNGAFNQAPTEFGLGSSYPNPFNPTTTIPFSLPERAKVQIAVYDVMGRRVAFLADGTYETGTHQVTFDASYLSSGVYLVHAHIISTSSGEAHTLTKRITLLK